MNDVLYVSPAAKNLLILLRLAAKGATMGATKYKTTIKKNGVSMILNAIKGVNDSTMFYLKAKTFSSAGSSPQEANINMIEKNEVQDDKNEKENIGTRR